MNNFYFYHYSKNNSTSQVELKNIAIWETCLRKIIFTENKDSTLSEEKVNFDLFEDEQALVFLLEVLCGLQSKVIGETEIFGQFKQFLETEDAKKISFFKNQQFVQFLFKQVKEIREKFITHLGVNSYGSMIRKICQTDEEISLIGYGQLAKKILPWLGQRQIKIYVRDKSKYQNQENFQFLNMSEAVFSSTLIVAAPIQTEHLLTLINSASGVSKIVDCRSLEEKVQSLKHKLWQTEIIELNDLFAQAEAKQEKMKSMIPLINQEIRDRVQSYLMKAQHRPQGWEDLCG